MDFLAERGGGAATEEKSRSGKVGDVGRRRHGGAANSVGESAGRSAHFSRATTSVSAAPRRSSGGLAYQRGAKRQTRKRSVAKDGGESEEESRRVAAAIRAGIDVRGPPRPPASPRVDRRPRRGRFDRGASVRPRAGARGVFARGWTWAGRCDQVSTNGSYLVGSTGSVKYVVVRGEDGVPRAFHNACRHHGMEVASSPGDVPGANHSATSTSTSASTSATTDSAISWIPELREPIHVGEVLRVPVPRLDLRPRGLARQGDQDWRDAKLYRRRPRPEAHTGRGVGTVRDAPRRETPAASRRTARWRGWARTSPRKSPGTRGPMSRNRRVFVARREYRLRCNWKVFADNYLDGGYHVPFAHPALVADGVDMKKYETEIFGEYVSVQTVNGPRHSSGVPAIPPRGGGRFAMAAAAIKEPELKIGQAKNSGEESGRRRGPSGCPPTPPVAKGSKRARANDRAGRVISSARRRSVPGRVDQAGRLAHSQSLRAASMINRYGPWMDTNVVLPGPGPNECVVLFDYFIRADADGADEKFMTESLRRGRCSRRTNGCARRFRATRVRGTGPGGTRPRWDGVVSLPPATVARSHRGGVTGG